MILGDFELSFMTMIVIITMRVDISLFGFGHRFMESSGWFGFGLDLVLTTGSWIRPVDSVLVWKLKLFHLDPFLLGIYIIPISRIYEKFNQLFEKLSLVVVVRVGYSLLGGYFEKLRLSLCYLT